MAFATARLASLGMRGVFHRDATNLPGAIACKIDPHVLDYAASRLQRSVCVIGTNGKTTTNNLIADVIECAGLYVTCNRKGSNMTGGIVSALAMTDKPQIGVFECDELFSRFIVPAVKPDCVVLLNLFRDQLDRSGEIDRVQDAIAEGLSKSPDTVIIHNADDPLVARIVMDKRLANHKKVSFGIDGKMGDETDRVPMESKCPSCGRELSYDVRQYAQIGEWRCDACGCRRETPDIVARDVEVADGCVTFDAVYDGDGGEKTHRISMACDGGYMVYNLLAAFTACCVVGVGDRVGVDRFDDAVAAYEPMNGRQSHMVVDGVDVTLNLAKNPAGFNRNISMLLAKPRPITVAISINDDDVDGNDVSWLWDVDFERLCGDGIRVMLGGKRADDMCVRMRYAGDTGVSKYTDVSACVAAAKENGEPLYVLTNYSPLLPTLTRLRSMADGGDKADENARRVDAGRRYR